MIQTTGGGGSGVYTNAGQLVISGRPTDTSTYGNIYIQTGATQQNQWTFNNGAAFVLPGGTTTTTGTGITFPATQSASSDANTLDDYEEGTWTPVLGTGSSPPTFTYTNRGGTYIKVGLQVTAWFYFNINVTVSGSGFAGLVTSSLPFAPENVTYTNSAYAMGGFAIAIPSVTGGVALGFNNDNPSLANRLYWVNASAGTPTGASSGLATGVYSGYAVYRAAS
jgi:hypothetical protein